MLKNKTIFKSIAVALIMIMMVAALSPSVGMVYAITGSNGATGTTDVNYEVDQTGWTFSVPAAQTFTKGNLTLYGNVSISPESGKDIISLPSGQTINMTFTAANFNNGVFELRNGSNSVIPYKIGEVTRIASEGVSEEVSDITSDGCTVLTYIAGSSSNEGVTNKLRFTTTPDNIKNAKVTGLHTDTLTFTVNVTGGTSGGGSESGGSTTPTLISFTIDGKSYQAEEGMSWDRWTYSDYNTSGFKTSAINIVNSSGTMAISYQGTEIKPNDTIMYDRYGLQPCIIIPTTSTFTIDGTSYEFEEGMTWADWVDSSYNTDEFAVFDSVISKIKYYASGRRILIDSDTVVQSTDEIIPNYSYEFGMSN